MGRCSNDMERGAGAEPEQHYKQAGEDCENRREMAPWLLGREALGETELKNVATYVVTPLSSAFTAATIRSQATNYQFMLKTTGQKAGNACQDVAGRR